MKFITKYVVLGLVLWFTLILPGSARSAEEMFRVIPLTVEIKDGLRGSAIMRACGDYFAAAETTSGRIIHFNYEILLPEKAHVWAFYMIDDIVPRVNDSLPVPIAVIGSQQTKIWMNAQDFKASLPCLANGANV